MTACCLGGSSATGMRTSTLTTPCADRGAAKWIKETNWVTRRLPYSTAQQGRDGSEQRWCACDTATAMLGG